MQKLTNPACPSATSSRDFFQYPVSVDAKLIFISSAMDIVQPSSALKISLQNSTPIMGVEFSSRELASSVQCSVLQNNVVQCIIVTV